MKFVFDLETIPDYDLIRELLQDKNSSHEELINRAAIEINHGKSDFMPPMLHRIVAWVGLWIDSVGNPVQQASWSGHDEAEGLKQLFDTLLTYKDFGVVHHNGKSFDLPVLTYRSMKYMIQMPRRLHHRDIRYRYSNENIDLMDEFSNYGASSYPKLKQLGYLIGIPFKQTAEGNLVHSLFEQKKLKEIEHYCLEDVISTYIIWIHLQFVSGEMNEETFQNLKTRALRKLKDIQDSAMT